MADSFEIISFPKQTKTKIGGTTYIINSHFDENGESLKEKIKHLIILEINEYSNFTVGQAKNI